MDDFLQDKPKKNKGSAVVFRGYRRLFALVFAVAVLWQCVSFLQMQLSNTTMRWRMILNWCWP